MSKTLYFFPNIPLFTSRATRHPPLLPASAVITIFSFFFFILLDLLGIFVYYYRCCFLKFYFLKSYRIDPMFNFICNPIGGSQFALEQFSLKFYLNMFDIDQCTLFERSLIWYLFGSVYLN